MNFIPILTLDVSEKIFNFLDTKSFLDCFLVCKSWNDFLGDSLVFRRRFLLDLRRVKYSIYKQDNIATNMTRKFTSAFVYYYPWKNCEQRVAMMNRILRKNKIVKICLELSFFECTKSEFLSYLSMFEGSLDELRIQMLTITNDTDGTMGNAEVDLKSLKSIEIIQGANGDFMFDLVRNATNLKSIKLGGTALYDKVNEFNVYSILMRQRNITKLHMDFEWSEIFFKTEEFLSDYPFSLKELVVFVEMEDLNNVKKFLEKQNSIEVLNINVYDLNRPNVLEARYKNYDHNKSAVVDIEFIKQLLKLQMLSSLRLTASGMETCEGDCELPVSKSLRNVKLGSKFYENIEPKTLKKLIVAMPQVKFITVLQSKKISIESILHNLKDD